MTNAQWFGIMWMLSMICYYISDKNWGPLIGAWIFLMFGAYSYLEDKSNE